MTSFVNKELMRCIWLNLPPLLITLSNVLLTGVSEAHSNLGRHPEGLLAKVTADLGRDKLDTIKQKYNK